MSAFPEPADGDERWDDWSPWDEMALLERNERRGNNWISWVGRLLGVALILPIVLGLLVAMLIWLF